MFNALLSQLRQYAMVEAGDTVWCAVSGGADSMALLTAMQQLAETLQISVAAVHFNHKLRGAESDAEEAFVRSFCAGRNIPLTVGSSRVKAGKKGLEAAAREARYGFFATLPGKIATAHTADDNAETVLMHLVRGTGLKGLGGIAPVNGNIIRPMLTVTRQRVLEFLEQQKVSYVTDSSNHSDEFLRNRLRHHVMPLLKQENPNFSGSISAMAMQLRQDEAALSSMAEGTLPSVDTLRQLPEAVCSRYLERFLKENGVREPERCHIQQARELIFSEKPSAYATFPGGVILRRNYKTLEADTEKAPLETVILPERGETDVGEFTVVTAPAETAVNTESVFTVQPQGAVTVRCRKAGDILHLPGGSKAVKELFIDKKIPAAVRLRIPVVADEAGLLGVYGIGADLHRRTTKLPALQISFIRKK